MMKCSYLAFCWAVRTKGLIAWCFGDPACNISSCTFPCLLDTNSDTACPVGVYSQKQPSGVGIGGSYQTYSIIIVL